MRLFLVLVCLVPVLSVPAWATDPPAAAAPHGRQTQEQHFTEANLAHDGHLTLAEAKGGYPQVAKHFDDIDVDHRGYVTENDIRAWQVMRKAARRLGKPQEDKLRPRSATQADYPGLHKVKASGSQIVAPPVASPSPAN
jgi:hypothetical protein